MNLKRMLRYSLCGAATVALLIGAPVSADQVDKNTFKVYVRRVLAEGAMTPTPTATSSSAATSSRSK